MIFGSHVIVYSKRMRRLIVSSSGRSSDFHPWTPATDG